MKKTILFGILLAVSHCALAVNPVALWMPVSLQDLMPQLMKAAEMAEATERCDKVMSGRHSSKRSTVERPVFSIVCRDAETKRTYSILYAVENGEVVEFNEQQRITGAKGETVARPWENPALKPVQDTGQAQVSAANSAAVVTSTTAARQTISAASQVSAPEVSAPPETPIDPRLEKLMARLEAAGVKGASAKIMMADMQKKTLEDNLAKLENKSSAKSTSSVKPAPSAQAVNRSPDAEAAALASGLPQPAAVTPSPANSAPTNPDAASVATLPAALPAAQTTTQPAIPAAEVSNAIAAQLWSQCLPAIKAKTASMIDRVLDEKTIPAGYSADAGATSMDVPFEAKNPEGMNLRFTAVCTVDAAGAATVKLRPRRE